MNNANNPGSIQSVCIASSRVPVARSRVGRRLLQAALLSLASIVLAACASGPKITADYDRGADFSQYRSFGFFEPLGTDKAGYESLVTQALKSATRREMEARGYTYAESGADLLVNFNAKLAKALRVSSTPAPMYYGYRRGYYGGWGGYGYSTHVDQYVEGTLNIDIIDPRRQQLVWEGVAVGRVKEKAQEQRQAAIASAVAEIFTKYPFRVGP
jgi:hypothetical protein